MIMCCGYGDKSIFFPFFISIFFDLQYFSTNEYVCKGLILLVVLLLIQQINIDVDECIVVYVN